jgi:hypothetical protein
MGSEPVLPSRSLVESSKGADVGIGEGSGCRRETVALAEVS